MDSRLHWREYALEAALLGLFMLSACFVTALVEHPSSFVRAALASDLARRALIGAAMGVTAVALIHSPWGVRSGAHFNPAVTIAFHRLGKIGTGDTIGYVVAQCIGAVAGVQLAHALLGMLIAHPAVAFAATVPGARGAGVAFVAEATISFVQMSTVLLLANGPWRRCTGIAAGVLVAIWITFEAPLSGMSMNPARSFGSALGAGVWRDFWIYATAPLAGMIVAAELHARLRGAHRVYCAKLVHGPSTLHCIFRCTYGALAGVTPGPTARPTAARVAAETLA
jgi:aquaporin Z